MMTDKSKFDGDENNSGLKSSTGRLRFCKQCTFSCTSSKTFLQHQFVVHNETRYTRETEIVAAKTDYDSHHGRHLVDGDITLEKFPRNVNARTRSYSCKMCDFTTMSSKSYLAHEKEEHKIEFTVHECDVCDYATKYRTKLTRHKKVHLSDLNTKLYLSASDRNSCVKENFPLAVAPGITQVKEEKDMFDEKELSVAVCTTAVIPKEISLEHHRKKRQKVDPAKYIEVFDETGKKFRCTLCDTNYKWRKSLNKHWNEKHVGEESYLIPRCKEPPDESELSNKENENRDNSKFYEAAISVSSPSSYMHVKSCSKTSTSDTHEELSDASVKASHSLLMPKIIGPFITDTHMQEDSDLSTGCHQAVVMPKMVGPFVIDSHMPVTVNTPIINQGSLLECSLHKEDNTFPQNGPQNEDDFKNQKIKNLNKQHQLLEGCLITQETREKFNNNTTGNKGEKIFAPPLEASFNTVSAGASNKTPGIHSFGGIQQSRKRQLSDTDFQLTKDNISTLMDLQMNSNYLDSSVSMPIESAKNSEEPVLKLQITNIQTLCPTSSEEFSQGSDNHNITDKHEIISHVPQKSMLDQQNSVKEDLSGKDQNCLEIALKYKCPLCAYRARWPSDITQHAKNHSDEKPYHCPRCVYKSKWKWDVVKHLKKCGEGGGTLKDVIDTTKLKEKLNYPPNVSVTSQGHLEQTTLQPAETKSFVHITTVNDEFSKQKLLSPNNVNIVQLLDAPSLNSQQKFIPLNGNIFKLQQSSDLSKDDTFNQSSPKQQKETTFTSLVNEGLHHCLECPFIGYSFTELKHHSLLHSVAGALTCDVCGFCTKEKYDLKKHIETYNHFSSSQTESDDFQKQSSTSETNYAQGSSMASQTVDENKPQQSSVSSPTTITMNTTQEFCTVSSSMSQEYDYVYKCSDCAYVTFKKHMYEQHMNIHGCQVMTKNTSVTSSKSTNPDKLNCNKCPFIAQDLSAFLQHNLTHSSDHNLSDKTKISDPPVLAKSLGTSHMKHRRKPLQQFKCSKCPYVCFKKSGLEMHTSMHEPRGKNSLQCSYCDYNVFNRNILFQHMMLHLECKVNDGVDVGKKNAEAEINLKEHPGQDISEKEESLMQIKYKLEYQCEWCEAILPNVAHLYHHSQMAHNEELMNQEIKMYTEVDENSNHTCQKFYPESTNGGLGEKMIVTTRDIEPQFSATKPSAAIFSNVYNESYTPKKVLKEDNTEKKIPIANAVTYLRHMEIYGNSCKSTCNFHNYDINQLALSSQNLKLHSINTSKHFCDKDVECRGSEGTEFLNCT